MESLPAVRNLTEQCLEQVVPPRPEGSHDYKHELLPGVTMVIREFEPRDQTESYRWECFYAHNSRQIPESHLGETLKDMAAERMLKRLEATAKLTRVDQQATIQGQTFKCEAVRRFVAYPVKAAASQQLPAASPSLTVADIESAARAWREALAKSNLGLTSRADSPPGKDPRLPASKPSAERPSGVTSSPPLIEPAENWRARQAEFQRSRSK